MHRPSKGPFLSRNLATLAAAALAAFTAAAGPSNEAVVTRLEGMERLQLQSLRALDARALAEISARTTEGRLERRAGEIASLGLPAIGSRAVGPDGRSPIHHYILAEAARLAPRGLRGIGTFRGTVAAPVSLDRLLDPDAREAPASIEVDGRSIKVHPLWPNGPMPSLAPADGVRGPLLYCGNGEWDDLKGLPLQGAIALLDFGGATNLERLFSLGVAAVVVLEDDALQYQNAKLLFSQTPSPFPRFYATAGVRRQLLEIAASSVRRPALLRGGQLYEERPVESLFFHLPAPGTISYTVPDGLLLEWIAASHGVNTAELDDHNNLKGRQPQPGQTVRIPGSTSEFVVPGDGLWGAVARLHDMDAAALKAANPGQAGAPLAAGMTIAIPGSHEPLLVLAGVDTASVVPDLPHGGMVVANVAAAIELMDFLCSSDNLRLRRDVVFGFIDGDSLGGQGSRLVAEYTFLLEGPFKRATAAQSDSVELLRRYKAGAEWFATGTLPADAAVQRWLVEQWLRPRFEERRILIAEDRIATIVQSRGHEKLPPREQLEADLERIAALRDATVARTGSESSRLDALMAAWSGADAADLARFALGREELRRRFIAELAEEERSLANHGHNLAAAARLREVLRAGQQSLTRPLLAWRLDLADSFPYLGLNHSADSNSRMLGDAVGVRQAKVLAPRLRRVAAFAASRAGWGEDYTFIAEEDNASLSIPGSPATTTYDNFWMQAGCMVIPLSGEGDRRERTDTPADTVEAVNWAALNVQARTVYTLVAAGLESLLDTRLQENRRAMDMSRIGGSTVQFNIRSGIDAKDPVPGAYVFLTEAKGGGGFADQNTDCFYGYRRGIVQKSSLNGSFLMPPAITTYNTKPRIYAYKLDRERALFTKVATQGQVGTKPQKNEFAYRPGEVTEKNLVLIDAYPRVIFAGYNPSTLKSALGGAYSTDVITLTDAVTQGTPRDYAMDNPITDFRETDREAVTLYLPENDRVRAVIQGGIKYNLLLMGPVELDARGEARGKGILIGPDPDAGGRNILLPLTPLHIARGMWQLADNRLAVYRRYGISSRELQQAVDRGGGLLREADTAVAAGDWQRALGYSRDAWGIMVKNFPRVLKLGREAVFSVILLMALAVPGAWFLERLVIGSKGIVARLAGICAIFVAATLFLNFFHPAFQIALSPFIIVIAFTMILMSAIVLALSYARFEVVLRRVRTAGGEVHSEEISFMSSLATAFSLGVSNLKKRTFRTGLTVFTVTVLTFSIVGFVAVRGRDTLQLQPVPLNDTVEGQPVAPLPPACDGILVRGHNWRGVSDSKLAALEAEFGGDFAVTKRAHFMQQEGGNQASREGVNQIMVSRAGRKAVVNAISLFMPNEPDFSGLDRAVSHGAWFTPSDRFAVILPDKAAAMLGISAAMLADAEGKRLPDDQLPVVRMQNIDWKVIGILDTALANRIRDINGHSPAVVDFLRSGMATNTSEGQIVTEGKSYHMDWARLAVAPYAARNYIDAKPRSIAVRIPEGTDFEMLLGDLALRLDTEFFAASGGAVSMVLPRAKVDLAGMAKVFLPVILCVLIVMNTMLGTVEERRGEVGMLGAIGLSPRQIAFLMFSESTVFSVLGILLGTFGGLLFANIVNSVNAAGGQFLTSLSFNFTSMLSMVLATGTGLVVLMATLIPAGRAAALAAPSGMAEWVLPEEEREGEIGFRLPFTLTRGNAVGMAAFFHQFLVNHNEPTSEDFNCRHIDVSAAAADGMPAITLRTDMWLAPYDLDVAQHFTLRLREGARGGVFEVDLHLARFSGSLENSRRTSYSLLNLVRRQFLLWRNLDPAQRARFIGQGAELLGRGAGARTTSTPT